MTIVGVPTEVKKDEYRVGLRPVGAEILIRNGNSVLVQAGAGIGSGYDDALYLAYFHFAADRELTVGCLERGCISVAYETLTDNRWNLCSYSCRRHGRRCRHDGHQH